MAIEPMIEGKAEEEAEMAELFELSGFHGVFLVSNGAQ